MFSNASQPDLPQCALWSQVRLLAAMHVLCTISVHANTYEVACLVHVEFTRPIRVLASTLFGMLQDTPRNIRFSINFFTSIGLGGLTDKMRADLQEMPKQIAAQQAAAKAAQGSDDSSSSSDDSSSSSSSDDSSSSG